MGRQKSYWYAYHRGQYFISSLVIDMPITEVSILLVVYPEASRVHCIWADFQNCCYFILAELFFPMLDTSQDSRCSEFADYIVQFYVTSQSRFPSSFWVAVRTLNSKQTNNGPKSFYSHFNKQFYAAHPSILIFIDVL
jgi:hypothetical protein